MLSAETRALLADAGRRGAEVTNGKLVTTRGRVAARYAHLWGVSVSAAAREFELSPSTVQRAWQKLYPGESACLGKRGRR